MADEKETTLPAGPMTTRLRTRGAKAALAKKLRVDPQNISNWIKRGVPKGRIPEVAAHFGISTEKYYLEAGAPLEGTGRKQGELDSSMLVSDFEALPASLRAVVARKATDLREHWESIPQHLRAIFSAPPPTDPEHYRAWELSIEAALKELTKGKPQA